ncbi:MAG TPA: hypothetical protein VLX85_15440 [Stellaceae bacterium]|nr:hypothetical protein [Stellaceae bacterium]
MRSTFFVLAALFALPWSSAAAETVNFAGRSVVLDVPEGYCRLDPANTTDAQYIDAMKKVQEGRNYIVFMFASCDGLKAARAGKLDQLTDSGAVMVIMNGGNIVAVPSMTRPQFIDEASRRVAVADTASVRNELRQRTEQVALGVDLGGMKVLGVLKKDDLGVYIGFLLPPSAGANAPSIMSINAISLVNSLRISVVIGRPVVREGVADELLTIEQRTVKRLIAANAATEAASAESDSEGGILEYAIIGAAVGGIGVPLGLLLRRSREAKRGSS